MLCHVPLPVALNGELEAALVADEGFDAAVGAHVLLQQGLPQIGLVRARQLTSTQSLSAILTFLHREHLKGRWRWFLCCHMWFRRLHLATNCFLQISQLYGFCPWCFTLNTMLMKTEFLLSLRNLLDRFRFGCWSGTTGRAGPVAAAARPGQQTIQMKFPLPAIVAAGALCGLQAAPRNPRQTNFGQETKSGTNDTDSRLLIPGANPALDSVVLPAVVGAAVGVGGLLLVQGVTNGLNQAQTCVCPDRTRRQAGGTEDGTDQRLLGLLGGGRDCACECECSARARQARDGTDQRLFGLLGGGAGSCQCSQVNTGDRDCRGRDQTDTYYGCGCPGYADGGIVNFGRRKRQVNLPGNSGQGEGDKDTDNRFLNFRCIAAGLSGRGQTAPPAQG